MTPITFLLTKREFDIRSLNLAMKKSPPYERGELLFPNSYLEFTLTNYLFVSDLFSKSPPLCSQRGG